jgi:hypothetical protein
MHGVHRPWLRRIATTASVAIVLYALYRALPQKASCPPPAHPRPGAGYACDPSGPTYHHPLLWLTLAAISVLGLAAARRFLREQE